MKSVSPWIFPHSQDLLFSTKPCCLSGWPHLWATTHVYGSTAMLSSFQYCPRTLPCARYLWEVLSVGFPMIPLSIRPHLRCHLLFPFSVATPLHLFSWLFSVHLPPAQSHETSRGWQVGRVPSCPQPSVHIQAFVFLIRTRPSRGTDYTGHKGLFHHHTPRREQSHS